MAEFAVVFPWVAQELGECYGAPLCHESQRFRTDTQLSAVRSAGRALMAVWTAEAAAGGGGAEGDGGIAVAAGGRQGGAATAVDTAAAAAVADSDSHINSATTSSTTTSSSTIASNSSTQEQEPPSAAPLAAAAAPADDELNSHSSIKSASTSSSSRVPASNSSTQERKPASVASAPNPPAVAASVPPASVASYPAAARRPRGPRLPAERRAELEGLVAEYFGVSRGELRLDDILAAAEVDPRRPREEWTSHAAVVVARVMEEGERGDSSGEVGGGGEGVGEEGGRHGGQGGEGEGVCAGGGEGLQRGGSNLGVEQQQQGQQQGQWQGDRKLQQEEWHLLEGQEDQQQQVEGGAKSPALKAERMQEARQQQQLPVVAAGRTPVPISSGATAALEAFVRGWRQHFLEAMQPAFLPPHWSVDARVSNSSVKPMQEVYAVRRR